MVTMRWQHWINFMSGGWLFASPWVLDDLNAPFTAAFNAIIVGAAILFCSLLALQFEDMEKNAKATLLLGAWTLLAPWILKATDPATLAANTVGVGLLVLLMSAWMLAEENTLIRWRRKRSSTLPAHNK